MPRMDPRFCIRISWLAALVLALTAAAEGPANPPHLPHIHIDRENRVIDLNAQVIIQRTVEGQWLELLACTPGSREHEAILTVQAQPSHVHLALMLLGLEAGSPMRWSMDETGVKIEALPKGPRVAVTALYEREGKSVEVPVHEWVRNRATGKMLDDNIWLFVGSRFVRHEERNIYIADLEGSVLSLVNFGDEVLAKPTELTRLTDNEAWMTVEEKVPTVGTKVVLRLRVVADPEEKDGSAKPQAAGSE